MADEDPTESAKRALSVLTTQIQTHESYHAQKENMTWLVTVTYLGAAGLLVGREPFWQEWSILAYSAWLILLAVTALVAALFLLLQFHYRHRAAAFFEVANDVATQWAAKPPDPTQLEPTELPELHKMLVAKDVVDRFRLKCRGKFSWPQLIAVGLVVLWSLAAILYVICTYTGSASLCRNFHHHSSNIPSNFSPHWALCAQKPCSAAGASTSTSCSSR